MPDNIEQGLTDFRNTVTPYLCTKNAAAAIDFYKEAFGATEHMRMTDPEDRVVHAELRIGNAAIYLADEFPEIDVLSPQTLGGSAVLLVLEVEDVDAIARQAVAAGATLIRPVEDQFYGERNCKLKDPFGHDWMISTHIEDVSPEEMKRRAKELFGGT